MDSHDCTSVRSAAVWWVGTGMVEDPAASIFRIKGPPRLCRSAFSTSRTWRATFEWHLDFLFQTTSLNESTVCDVLGLIE